jgi:tRNA(fMet)-specific endonuclease VapC
MRYLLDTNIVIFVLKDQSGKAAVRLAQETPDEVVVCSVAEAELYHGATKYGAPDRRRTALEGFPAPFRSLAFDSACVPNYAGLRDELERAGQMIGGNDMLIAAIALTHDLTLVTHNCGEFNRVSGLRVEDWSV